MDDDCLDVESGRLGPFTTLLSSRQSLVLSTSYELPPKSLA